MLAALLLVGVACQAAPIAPASAPPTSTPPTPASLVPTATTAVAVTLTASPISTATRAPATAPSEQALAFVPVPGRPSLLEFYEEG